MARLEPLATGLTFPEGPRWREGRLWFSDFYSHAKQIDIKFACFADIAHRNADMVDALYAERHD